MKRRVMVKKRERVGGHGTPYTLVDDYEATFHDWGVNFEEFETGPGNYSCAIVEKDDGKVETEPANMIMFLEPIKEMNQ